MATTKITETAILSALSVYFHSTKVDNDKILNVPVADCVAYFDKRIDQLAAKSNKAKVRAAEKRAEGDTLRKKIANYLYISKEFESADTITKSFDDANITRAKVVARLSQLARDGIVVKDQFKTEDNRKIMMYKIADENAEQSPFPEVENV